MTPLLEEAIARVSALPEHRQDFLATLLLRELNAERPIEFQVPEVSQVHEAKGQVYLEDEFLVFRFTVLNWGVLEGEWQTVKVERAVIDGLRFEKGFLKDKLLIDTRNQRLRDALPGDHRNEVLLRTRKRDRLEVGAFIERVHAWRRMPLAGHTDPSRTLHSPE